MGKVETWSGGYIMQKERITWEGFTNDLYLRFVIEPV